MNEFSEILVDLSRKVLEISWNNPNLCKEIYDKSNQSCIIQINNDSVYIKYSFNILTDIKTEFEISGKVEDEKSLKNNFIHIFLEEQEKIFVFVLPENEDSIPEQYKSEILEKISVDFSKYFNTYNDFSIDCFPEDIQTLLEEIGMTENTAISELLRWHRSLKYLSAMYSSLQDSKLLIKDGSYLLIKKRFKNIITIWNIYYDILDEQSFNNINLTRELYKLKQELSNLNIEFSV